MGPSVSPGCRPRHDPRIDLLALPRLRAAARAREDARRKPLTAGQWLTRGLLVLAAVPVLVRVAVVLFALASL